jgi:hypothetical protein
MKLFLFALLALLLVVNAEEATQSDSGIITLRYDEDSYADTWYIPNIGGGLQELTFNIKSGDKLVKGTVGGDTIKALQTDYTALDISKTVDGGSALFINPETYNPIDSATFKPLAQWNNEITVNEDIAIVDRSTAKTEDADFFSLSWFQPCPLGFTNLHSDFDPVLDAANSKLRLENGSPRLDIVFQLPNYYFNVATSYKTVCDSDPALSAVIGVGSGGCEVRYTSTIDYNAENCQFELDQANSGEDFSYHGTLYISADLTLTVGADALGASNTFNVVRKVESPLSWVVYLERLVTVDTQITLNNTDTCSQDSDCGPNSQNAPDAPASAQQAQGCCEPVDATAANPEYYCNCECNGGNGYNGDYCENDNEAPECTVANEVGTTGFGTITLSSTNGGCVFLTSSDFTAPTFTDNSGTYYVSRKVLDGSGATIDGPTAEETNGYDNTDLTDALSFCFSVGTHRIEWHAADVPSTVAHTANEHVICGYDITVEDDAKPYVDCAQCNGATGGIEAYLCVGSTKTGPVAQADLASYFDASNPASSTTTFAGESLTCDCSAAQVDPIPFNPSNTHNPWGAIHAIDVNDATVTHDDGLPTVANQVEGSNTVVYTADDQNSNSDTCSFVYIYDNTPPSCTDVDLGSVYPAMVDHPIHDNPQIYGNDTEAQTWTDPTVAAGTINADAAGFANITLGNLKKDGVEVTPAGPPVSGQTFAIPVDSVDGTVTYTAQYTVYDLAGNVGYCDWQLVVVNPDPCLWPNCDDRPPACNTAFHTFIGSVVNLDCDSDYSFADLSEPNYAGYTSNNDLIVKDDRGVTAVDFDVNGGGALLLTIGGVGANDLTFTGCDYHGDINNPTAATTSGSGGCAVCEWEVKIVDSTDPVLTCPETEGFTRIINTQDNTYDYTYKVNATDSCTLNTDVALEGGQQADQTYRGVGSYTGGDTLSPGTTYSYHYKATDDSGNVDECTWQVQVVDNGAPNITCPDDEYLRNDQGTTTSVYSGWVASANDAADGDLSTDITYTLLDGTSITSTYAFGVGINTVFAEVEDSAGNKANCTFTVTVAECYPDADIIPTLTAADITISSSDVYADDDTRTFNAELELTIITNEYHSITANTYTAVPEPSTFDGKTDTTEGTCESESEACYYKFSHTISLGTDCQEQERNFNFEAAWICQDNSVGADPVEDVCNTQTGSETYTATLVGSNYCWQQLIAGGLAPTATLILTQKTSYDSWVTAGADTTNPPTAQASFANKADIAGLVTIDSTADGAVGLSDDAYNGLTWKTLSKKHYPVATWEADGVDPTNTFDLLNLGSGSSISSDFVKIDSTTGQTANWAAFTYKEDDVELEAKDYVYFEGTLEIADLNLGARRLMKVRNLLQNGDAIFANAAAEAFMSAEPIAATATANENDAVVVLMLQNCADANSEWENALVNSIAKYLRIDTSRVTVSLDPTSEGYCLVEVTIAQSDCADNIDIISLLEYLETGIMDSFSELHTIVAQELPTDVTLDRSMFFVAQVPSTVYTAEAVTSSSTTTSDNGSELEWYYYAVAGFIAGLTVVVGLSYVCGNKTKASPQHTQLTPERRYSIADLLAATERRSSIDVNNVRLHNAL